MRQWRWLIVGAGSIGRRHLGNLLALGQRDLLVVDPDPAVLAEVSAQYGVEGVRELELGLSDRRDVAVIANPTALHVATALAAARTGCQLFIEKPLSDSLEGTEELARLVESHDLVALVGCNMRFHPGPRLMKHALDRRELGVPLGARFEVGSYLPSWRSRGDYRQSYSARQELGGGCILDAIHELDLACWLFGFPSEVFALTRDGNSLGIETEEMAEILLRYDDGLICSLHLDYVQRWRQRRGEVIGSHGSIVWESRRQTVERWLAGSDQPTRLGYDAEDDPNAMYLEEFQHFLRCLDRRENSCADLEWATRVTRLALMAKQSARDRQPVSVASELRWSS